MERTLEYRGYRATVQKDPNDGILYGKQILSATTHNTRQIG